ncbi:MAG: SRPBCC family protein [Gemmataceae bacterium]|nr:SRPBCC family protein [Gemmataceae bacterium]
MPGFTFTQVVQAPPAAVFAAYADFEHAPDRIADIVRVEVVTPGPVGVGTRFKESRLMFGRETTETMEVAAFDPPHGYELRAVSCGGEFRTRFAFTPEGNGTRVDVDFRVRAARWWAIPFVPLSYLMTGMVRKCLARDLDRLRAVVEGRRRAA